MHKAKYITSVFLLSLSIILIESCSHYDEIQKSGRESSASEKSHNAGKDCMSCHHDNSNEASGTGTWWSFAGTVYNNNLSVAASGGTVELWTGPKATGTFLYRVKIDGNGNCYTSKIFDFKGGYYPVIIKNNPTSSIDTSYMTNKISGDNLYKSCNNCHGNNGDGINTPKITFN
jgi:hypothetical protein